MAILTATEYRTYAGLAPTDAPTDAKIDRAIWRYESLVEGYLQRVMARVRQSEKYYFIDTANLVLARWPVLNVYAITDGASKTFDVTRMLIHHSKGEIYHRGLLAGQETVQVDYEAGWDINSLPDDIKVVVFALAEALLSGSGGGSAALSSAPIKKETMHGVATIEYDTSLLVDSGDGGIGSGRYAELGPYVSVLDKYRAPGWVA
jgi:hypothetical protein